MRASMLNMYFCYFQWPNQSLSIAYLYRYYSLTLQKFVLRPVYSAIQLA